MVFIILPSSYLENRVINWIHFSSEMLEIVGRNGATPNLWDLKKDHLIIPVLYKFKSLIVKEVKEQKPQ